MQKVNNMFMYQKGSRVHRGLFYGLIVITLLGFIQLEHSQLFAQEEFWSFPERIPGYDTLAKVPYLIADRNQLVHAFNTTVVEGQQVVVYSQWSLEKGWTYPVDILLPVMREQIRLKSVFLDQTGLVHMLFFSGDDESANIYYTNSMLTEAGSAQSWSKPIVVGYQAITPDEAAMVMDGRGRLLTLFSSNSQGKGLYFTQSDDRGRTWSDPTPFFLTYDDQRFPFFLQMYVDQRGNVHSLWNVNNTRGLSEKFYYARMESTSDNREEPITFDAGGLNEPAITEYQTQLILIYHSSSPTGLARYMRLSQDSGKSWSEPVRLFTHVGSNGPPSLVKDSSDRLHMFFGNRVTIENNIVYGMWYTVWNETEWDTPQAIVSGPNVVDVIGGNGFDPSYANAVVSQGNVILLTWTTDPGAGLNGVWYTFAKLESPQWPLEPIPMPNFPGELTELHGLPSGTPQPEQTLPSGGNLKVNDDRPIPSSLNNPASVVIYGIFPVVFFLAFLILLHRLQRTSSSTDKF